MADKDKTKKKKQLVFSNEFDLAGDYVLKETSCKVKLVGKTIDGVLFVTQNHICFAGHHSLLLHHKVSVNYKDVASIEKTAKGLSIAKTTGKKTETSEYFGFDDLNSISDFVEKMWKEQTGGGKSVKMVEPEPTLKTAEQPNTQASDTGQTNTTVNDTSYESDSHDETNDDENENNNQNEPNESDNEKDEKEETKSEGGNDATVEKADSPIVQQLVIPKILKEEAHTPPQEETTKPNRDLKSSRDEKDNKIEKADIKAEKQKKRKSLRALGLASLDGASPAKALSFLPSAQKSEQKKTPVAPGPSSSLTLAPFISLKPSSTPSIARYFPVRDPPKSKGKTWTEYKWEKPTWEKDFAFDAEPDEAPLKEWICAQKVKGGEFVHGLIFVTHRAVYFTNYNMGGMGVSAKVIIDFLNIVSIQNSGGKTLEVLCQGHNKPLIFGEFKDVDDAYKLMIGLWNPALRMAQAQQQQQLTSSASGSQTQLSSTVAPNSGGNANSNNSSSNAANSGDHKGGRLTQLVRSLSERSMTNKLKRPSSAVTTPVASPGAGHSSSSSSSSSSVSSESESKSLTSNSNPPAVTPVKTPKSKQRHSSRSSKHTSVGSRDTLGKVGHVRDRSKSSPGQAPEENNNNEFTQSDTEDAEVTEADDTTSSMVESSAIISNNNNNNNSSTNGIANNGLPSVASFEQPTISKEIFTVEQARNEADIPIIERIDAVTVYNSEFHSQQSEKLFHFLGMKNRICTIIISMVRAPEPFPPELGEPGEGLKGVLLDKNGMEMFYLSKSALKKGTTPSSLENFFTKVCVDSGVIFSRVEGTPDFSKRVHELTVQHVKPITGLKVGVLYIKPGQKKVEDVFNNQPPPESPFYEFMNGIAKHINLKGWTGYLGDFGQADEDRYTYFTQWENVDVMFHVTPLLTREQHRRLIGNDICFIIYFDSSLGSDAFDPSIVQDLGVMPQVFTVVYPQKPAAGGSSGTFRLSFFNRATLKQYSPQAPPKDYEFDLPSLKTYLFTKLHNGYVMSTKCPPMNRLFATPRAAAIKDLGERCGSQNKRKSARRYHRGTKSIGQDKDIKSALNSSQSLTPNIAISQPGGKDKEAFGSRSLNDSGMESDDHDG